MNEFTFTLNFVSASPDTYQNWCTVRVNGAVLERKSNAGGNGQTWTPFGYLLAGEQGTLTRLFNCNANESKAARIVATVLNRLGGETNLNGFGCCYANATWVHPTVNRNTGRKLTAAPSIREGRPPRDKNVKARRWNGSLADMIAARNARNGETQERLTIDPATLRVN